MARKEDRNHLVGTYAGLLALAEVGLGSALHAARIPLRGQFLSLNQIFILMKASLDGKKEASPAVISNIAAVLKSLSPAGNKLTPMLAIAMQGWLFSLGTLLFGHTFLGRLVGGILASFWAFAQPILLYGVIFGAGTLTVSFKEFARIFPFSGGALLYCICALAAAKALMVAAMAFLPFSWFDRWVSKISRWAAPKNRSIASSPIKGALRQMGKPLFLGSVVLTASLLYFAEKSSASLIWHLLRPLAIGFILFYSMRVFPIEKMIGRMKSSSAFGQALTIALNRLNGTHSNTSTESPADKKP